MRTRHRIRWDGMKLEGYGGHRTGIGGAGMAYDNGAAAAIPDQYMARIPCSRRS